MTVKDLLLHHLEYTFEKEAWQPSLAMAVDVLTAGQAAWKPSPQRHSIWQIVRHVIHWRRFLLEVWEGKKPSNEAYEAADWKDVAGDDADWQADVQALHALERRIKQRVQQASDDELITPLEGFRRPKAMSLAGMGTHDIYHAGQIRYLRALQGV